MNPSLEQRNFNFFTRLARTAIAAAAGLCAIAAMPHVATAQAVAVSPYTLATFAQSQTGYSDPDSVTFDANNIYVGYGNGGNPDGSGGAMSTIVKYTMDGTVVTTWTVVGHNDGLRIDPAGGALWALQNEDANANLAIIDTKTGKQKIYTFPSPAPHGGGYDDIDFSRNTIFVSASNPANNPNTGPAIVSIRPTGNTIKVTQVLAGEASATNVITGATDTLNLQDPDSMIFDNQGDLVLDSQADGELVIVQFPGLRCQQNFVVPLSYPVDGVPTPLMADDTAFVTANHGFLIDADKDAQTVYKITAPFFVIGAAYTSFQNDAGTAGFIGHTDLTSGVSTPIVTGALNPGGMAFIPDVIGKIKAPSITCP
jgi:hypothetical protein